MKVLIACIPNPLNSYMADLVEGLSSFATVTWDYKEFWACKNEYDIVHVHWPEYLSFEIESYLNNDKAIADDLWNRLKQSLDYWSKHSTIVYTRHVRAPHKRDDKEFKLLYKTVFEYCYGITHFANFSIAQFKDYFPKISKPIHAVIPQHNHASMTNASNKSLARKELKIGSDAKVLMCFGLIKENEKALINEAYKAIPGHNKVLLAPGWKIQRRKISYIRLREWVWEFEKWINKFNKKRRTDLGFIADESAHYYCNAADVLLIPRTNELFSGNISLGFTFGLVVVGKDDSNIGEILSNSNNPTFKVEDKQSLQKSISKAFKLVETKLGEANRDKALNDWSIERISIMYQDFYSKSMLHKKSAS
jgi:hypothetical protein